MPEIDLGLVRGKQGNPGTSGEDATINGFPAINIIAGKNINIDQSVPGTLEISASFDTSGFIPTEEKGAVGGVATLGPDGKLEENQRPVYTGEDIHVSEEDNTDMSTALSNKADKYPVLDIPADTSTPADYPRGLSIVNGDGGVYLTVVGLNEWRALQFYGAESEGLYYRVNNSRNPVGWTSLLKVATATPPEESDLPLVDGWTNVDRSTYFKMQNNVVVLTLSAQYISGTVTGENHVATLPEGYRPAKTIPALCGIGELGSTTGYIKVDASGNVFFGADGQGINKVFAQILFIGS